jgi:hypothetical protein
VKAKALAENTFIFVVMISMSDAPIAQQVRAIAL